MSWIWDKWSEGQGLRVIASFCCTALAKEAFCLFSSEKTSPGQAGRFHFQGADGAHSLISNYPSISFFIMNR